MRFLTPQRERVSDEAVQRAHMAGLDCIPSSCWKSWESKDLLRVERPIDESGNLHIPWRVEGHGELLLSTARLMERERPYHLPVELARGTVNRLRSRADIWRMGGLLLSDELVSQLKSAESLFTRAATSQTEPLAAADAAQEAIRVGLDAIVGLGEQYGQQVLEYRLEESSPLATLLAGNMGADHMPANAEPMFGAAFNTAVVPMAWKDVEPMPGERQWGMADKQVQRCLRLGLKIIGGPLVRLDHEVLPDWVMDYGDDFEQLAAYMRDYIWAAVEKYRGQIHLWHCAAGMNTKGIPSLSDEQRLRLTALAIETTRLADPRTPVIMSVDQPWAEYVLKNATELWPMHFAEMLVRADLGMAGIGLEINLGYWPGGTLPRDILEISDHIDHWSALGLPLILLLTVPSSDSDDPHACKEAGLPLPLSLDGGLSLESQKLQIERLATMLLAKQSVQALVWNQVFDSMPHKYAHAGVFDTSCMPKPALSSLISIRGSHLE